MSKRIFQVMDEFDGTEELLVSSFSGGDKGKCYQFTMNRGKGYIQVTKKTAQEIVIKLLTEMVMENYEQKENMP